MEWPCFEADLRGFFDAPVECWTASRKVRFASDAGIGRGIAPEATSHPGAETTDTRRVIIRRRGSRVESASLIGSGHGWDPAEGAESPDKGRIVAKLLPNGQGNEQWRCFCRKAGIRLVADIGASI